MNETFFRIDWKYSINLNSTKLAYLQWGCAEVLIHSDVDWTTVALSILGNILWINKILEKELSRKPLILVSYIFTFDQSEENQLKPQFSRFIYHGIKVSIWNFPFTEAAIEPAWLNRFRITMKWIFQNLQRKTCIS